MNRVWDFVRNISYIVMLVAVYLGINQILVIAEWRTAGRDSLVSDLLGVYEKVFASQQTNVNQADIIDQFLLEKNSPLSGQGNNFVNVATKYKLPVYLMVAMTGAESGFGLNGYATTGSYNAVGLGIHEGRRYDSWQAGIEDMGYVLRHYYFDEGRESPKSIQDKWAPRNIDGNGSLDSWADNVSYFMAELEKREVS